MSSANGAANTVIESDDDIIARNQGIRRRFIDTLTAEGKFPEDTKEKYVLLQAMADADRTAIQNKKIGSSEKQGAADRQAALIIAKMGSTFGSKSPFERQRTDDDEGEREPPRLDSAQLPAVELVPGETEIGLPSDNYESFMQRMEPNAEHKK